MKNVIIIIAIILLVGGGGFFSGTRFCKSMAEEKKVSVLLGDLSREIYIVKALDAQSDTETRSAAAEHVKARIASFVDYYYQNESEAKLYYQEHGEFLENQIFKAERILGETLNGRL
jgi:hypothetical protein